MKLHILIVEDDPVSLTQIKHICQRLLGQAAQLAAVTNIAEAARHSLVEPAEIILLDLGLPDSQGLESIWKIRSVFPLAPIVVVTGELSEQVHIQSLAVGAVHFVRKDQHLAGSLTVALSTAIRQINEIKRARDEELTQIRAILKLLKDLDTTVRANTLALTGNGDPQAGLAYRADRIWHAYTTTSKVLRGVGWAMLLAAVTGAVGALINSLAVGP